MIVMSGNAKQCNVMYFMHIKQSIALACFSKAQFLLWLSFFLGGPCSIRLPSIRGYSKHHLSSPEPVHIHRQVVPVRCLVDIVVDILYCDAHSFQTNLRQPWSQLWPRFDHSSFDHVWPLLLHAGFLINMLPSWPRTNTLLAYWQAGTSLNFGCALLGILPHYALPMHGWQGVTLYSSQPEPGEEPVPLGFLLLDFAHWLPI